MPHKIKSKAQYRMMQAIAHGWHPDRKGGGPSAAVAKELLTGYKSAKGLPARVRHRRARKSA